MTSIPIWLFAFWEEVACACKKGKEKMNIDDDQVFRLSPWSRSAVHLSFIRDLFLFLF